MNYFEKYSSNSLAGTSNQSYFISDGEEYIGRIFYKVFLGGRYNYSFLFSNITDSTFNKITYPDIVIDSWKIIKARVAVTNNCDDVEKIDGFTDITFFNKENLKLPDGLFCSDPVLISAEKDNYICVELTFKGEKIPYHPESQIMSYIFNNGEWLKSAKMPVVHCVGCDRNVEKRIGFLGDSITQGIGAKFNSYKNWCAVFAEKVGEKYSFWNLGIGFGQAQDAASDGIWLAKAKENDIVFVCYGVNDILGDKASAETIKYRLDTIIDKLLERGVKVIIQSVPPFNYSDEIKPIWEEVNEHIENNISKRVWGYFNNVPILCDDEAHISRYGGHPNDEGCKKWAEALYEYWHTIVDC